LFIGSWFVAVREKVIINSETDPTKATQELSGEAIDISSATLGRTLEFAINLSEWRGRPVQRKVDEGDGSDQSKNRIFMKRQQVTR